MKVVFKDSTCISNRDDKENNEIASTIKTNKITKQLITERASKEDNTSGNSQKIVQVPKDLKDDDFILVERKKSKKPPTIPSNPFEKNKMRSKPLIGSSTATSTLSSIPKNVHLHVSRLTPDTEAEILQEYLRPFVTSISSCEKLKSKRPEVYSSFRISLPASELEKVMDPQIWPQLIRKLGHINVRSLFTGFSELVNIVKDNNFDIVALSETWLTKDTNSQTVSFDGYTLFRKDRQNRGGGVDMYTLARYRFLTTVAPPRGGSAQLSVRVFKIPPVLICNITH
jgi:hypothetical protein